MILNRAADVRPISFREFPSTFMGRNTLGERYLTTLPTRVAGCIGPFCPPPTDSNGNRYDRETWDETP